MFSGLAQAMVNGCKGAVKEWDADWDRWVVEEGSKRMIKAGSTFAKDGHVAKLATLKQEAVLRFRDGFDD